MRTTSPLSHPPTLTHPEQLRLIGSARGLTPPLPSQARILVLGPLAAVEILNLALTLPTAELVCCELTPHELSLVREGLALFEPSEVRLRFTSFEALSRESACFDYILAPHALGKRPLSEHDQVLRHLHAMLVPNGLISLGLELSVGHAEFAPLQSYLQQAIAHLDSETSPIEALRAAWSRYTYHLSRMDSRRAPYAHALTQLGARLSDAELLTEWLEPPVSSDVLTLEALAQQAGLLLLDGARLSEARQALCDESIRPLLQALPPSARAAHYLDCFERLKRRELILCHHGLSSCALDQLLPPEHLAQQCFVSLVAQDPWSVSSRFEPQMSLALADTTLTLTGPTLRIALSALHHYAPRAIPFEALFEQVLAQLYEEHLELEWLASESGRLALRQQLLEDLRAFVHRDLVIASQLPFEHLQMDRRLPDTPYAHPLHRWMAQHLPNRAPLLNHHHRLVWLDSDQRAILSQLNGQLSLSALSPRERNRFNTACEALSRHAFLLKPSPSR